MNKLFVKTIGCRANQADTFVITSLLHNSWKLINNPGQADLVLINTCCVTSKAQRDCRKSIRRALDSIKIKRVIVFGCAVNAIDNFKDGFDSRVKFLSMSQSSPSKIVSYINSCIKKDIAQRDIRLKRHETAQKRSRVLLKIQTGCSHGCSYCIVPKARGAECSMNEAEIFKNVDMLLEQGFLEIVLTGVQLGAWSSNSKKDLPELLSSLADHISPARLRISSIEPWSVTEKLIETVLSHKRICSHLHIPLQSGDSKILSLMKRGYNAKDYLRIAKSIKNMDASASLGTDIIIGFPHEDENAFLNTFNMVKDCGFSYLHVFPFSPRPHTVWEHEKKDEHLTKTRVLKMLTLGKELKAGFLLGRIGTHREIIVENTSDGVASGLTDNYIKVKLKNSRLKRGTLHKVKLTGPCKDDELHAEIIN